MINKKKYAVAIYLLHTMVLYGMEDKHGLIALRESTEVVTPSHYQLAHQRALDAFKIERTRLQEVLECSVPFWKKPEDPKGPAVQSYLQHVEEADKQSTATRRAATAKEELPLTLTESNTEQLIADLEVILSAAETDLQAQQGKQGTVSTQRIVSLFKAGLLFGISALQIGVTAFNMYETPPATQAAKATAVSQIAGGTASFITGVSNLATAIKDNSAATGVANAEAIRNKILVTQFKLALKNRKEVTSGNSTD